VDGADAHGESPGGFYLRPGKLIRAGGRGVHSANDKEEETMIPRRFIAAVVLLLLSVASASAADAPASLYKRLGGYDAIAAVVDDFLGRLAGDTQTGRFFQGVSADHQKAIRQLVVDQVCAATGGPCFYIGRDMKSTHAGLGIAKADWDKAVSLFLATLDKFKVPQKESDELVAIVGSLEKDIVEKP
jgi:hemoglobin